MSRIPARTRILTAGLATIAVALGAGAPANADAAAPTAAKGTVTVTQGAKLPKAKRAAADRAAKRAATGLSLPGIDAKTRSSCTWYGYCVMTVDVARTRALCRYVCRYSNSSLAAIGGAAAAACSPIGGVTAIACATAAAVYGGWFMDNLSYANNAGRCIEFRAYRTPYGFTPPWIGTTSVSSDRCTSS